MSEAITVADGTLPNDHPAVTSFGSAHGSSRGHVFRRTSAGSFRALPTNSPGVMLLESGLTKFERMMMLEGGGQDEGGAPIAPPALFVKTADGVMSTFPGSIADAKKFLDQEAAKNDVKLRARVFTRDPETRKLCEITLKDFELARSDIAFYKGVKWVVFPESPVRRTWDVVVLFLLAYTVTILPLRTAFFRSNGIDPVDVTVDCLFFMDIVMSFFTATEDFAGKLEVRHSKIAEAYLKGWFIIDVIATFPFYLFTNLSIGGLSSLLRVPRLMKVFRLVRLIKLLRAYRFKKVFEDIEFSSRVHPGFVRLSKVMFVVAGFLHFGGCLWYLVGSWNPDKQEESWITRALQDRGFEPVNEDTPVLYLYALSVYFATMTMTTVGFGDVHAKPVGELLFAIAFMMIGTATFSFITATLSSALSSSDQTAMIFREKMSRLITALKSHFYMDPRTRHRVVATMRRQWRSPKTHYYSKIGELLREIPVPLRYDVAFQFHDSLVTRCQLFQACLAENETDFVGELVSNFMPIKRAQGEFFAEGTQPGEFLFFVNSGSVEVNDKDIQPLTLGAGDCMGLVSMLLGHKLSYTMRCRTEVVVFQVAKRVVFNTLSHHPGCYSICSKFAKDQWASIAPAEKNTGNFFKKRLSSMFQKLSRFRHSIEEMLTAGVNAFEPKTHIRDGDEYLLSFTRTEFVDWHIANRGTSIHEAIEVGQVMLALGLLLVVYGEDDGSFDEAGDTLYRFQQHDEAAKSPGTQASTAQSTSSSQQTNRFRVIVDQLDDEDLESQADFQRTSIVKMIDEVEEASTAKRRLSESATTKQTSTVPRDSFFGHAIDQATLFSPDRSLSSADSDSDFEGDGEFEARESVDLQNDLSPILPTQPDGAGASQSFYSQMRRSSAPEVLQTSAHFRSDGGATATISGVTNVDAVQSSEDMKALQLALMYDIIERQKDIARQLVEKRKQLEWIWAQPGVKERIMEGYRRDQEQLEREQQTSEAAQHT